MQNYHKAKSLKVTATMRYSGLFCFLFYI